MNSFTGDLTGLGWAVVVIGGLLTLLFVITCIYVIWAASLYVDKARGINVRRPSAAQERPGSRRAARAID